MSSTEAAELPQRSISRFRAADIPVLIVERVDRRGVAGTEIDHRNRALLDDQAPDLWIRSGIVNLSHAETNSQGYAYQYLILHLPSPAS